MNVIATKALAVPLDVQAIREQFPILSERPRGRRFVFLDSAASAQKPRAVIDAMSHQAETVYANVHRGLHWMSERATEGFEAARAATGRLLHAASPNEIVFTRNSTEAINLVAHSYLRALCRPGDAVLITEMEHHSNIVPWLMARDAAGFELRVARVTDTGELDLDDVRAKLADGKVKLVACTHMSNVLGTVPPVLTLIAAAHDAGAKVLLDGSQAVVHRRVDVQALGCDFYVFTGHKLYGPTGIGVLWARAELLDAMPPFLGGGDMISTVSFEKAQWAPVPAKFEAGTPAILEATGLKAAIEWVEAIGIDRIAAHEAALTEYAMGVLDGIEGLTVLGRAQDRGGVFAFHLAEVHAHDVATMLDRAGIAVRAGRHCAEPLHARFGVESTSRASFGIYTTRDEIDLLGQALVEVRRFFA